MILLCPVIDGDIRLTDLDKRYVAEWKCEEVKIEPHKETRDRTAQANRYYWGVVLTMIAEETGHTTEELHEFFKMLLLDRKFIEVGDEEFMIPKSTTSLSTKEFAEYIERVRAFAAENLSVSIPDPQP